METLNHVPSLNGQGRIQVSKLTKYFYSHHGRVKALQDVSFTVPTGEFLCVIGPSGCGKTTLLRILAGLENQTNGEIEISSSRTDKPLSSIVFQEKSVLPWLSIWENVAWGLKCRRVPKKQIRPVVEAYLRKLGLWDFRDAYPHQLSGGMNQRVSVARAFANDPEILLMDEPFGALDAQTRSVLQEELLHIWEETRKTVVFITHSLDEALLLADRILVMTKRPGRIKELVRVDIPRPRSQGEVRKTSEFSELFTYLWESLREEVGEVMTETGS